jgi:myo-inositol-1(or 4)-monophosphatase
MELEQALLSKLLEVATVSARLAGQRAMEEMSYIKTSIKNTNEIVTQADGICQKIIIDHVKENFPDHGFVAEEGSEGKLLKIAPRGDSEFWWVIDPIDGTNNFAHRVLAFSVSVGVIYKGFPIAGVIFDPGTESTWTAVKSEAPRLNAAQITCSTESINLFSCFAIDNYLQDVGHIPPCLANIMLRSRFRDLGSTALHLAYVASGGFVGMVNATPKLWDIAAGAFIAECAGAKVTDLKGNPIWPFDVGSYTGGKCPILAAGPSAHLDAFETLKNYPA